MKSRLCDGLAAKGLSSLHIVFTEHRKLWSVCVLLSLQKLVFLAFFPDLFLHVNLKKFLMYSTCLKILSRKSFGQRVHSSEKVFKKWVKCT